MSCQKSIVFRFFFLPAAHEFMLDVYFFAEKITDISPLARDHFFNRNFNILVNIYHLIK